MATETFPAFLPRVSRSLRIDNETNVIRTQFETGRARQRNRFARSNLVYSVTWQLSDFEYGIFEAWHRLQLSNGNEWFNITLPATQGLQTVEARFVGGDYSKRGLGVLYWEVSATLEVFENYGTTQAALDAFLNIPIEDLASLQSVTDELGIFVNTTLPTTYAAL